MNNMIIKNVKDNFEKYQCKIGIEFECGIFGNDIYELGDVIKKYIKANTFRCDTDGSVSVSKPIGINDEDVWYPNMEITCVIEKFENIKNVLEILHGYGFQNGSCGNHFHFSMNNKSMMNQLVSKITYRKIIKYLTYFFESNEKTRERLKNNYCSAYGFKEGVLSYQLRASYKCSDRYTPINLNPYFKYGTIEVRILPCFNDYMEHYYSIVSILNVLFNVINNVKVNKHGSINLDTSIVNDTFTQTENIKVDASDFKEHTEVLSI